MVLTARWRAWTEHRCATIPTKRLDSTVLITFLRLQHNDISKQITSHDTNQFRDLSVWILIRLEIQSSVCVLDDVEQLVDVKRLRHGWINTAVRKCSHLVVHTERIQHGTERTDEIHLMYLY